jgi:hypothetical protein
MSPGGFLVGSTLTRLQASPVETPQWGRPLVYLAGWQRGFQGMYVRSPLPSGCVTATGHVLLCFDENKEQSHAMINWRMNKKLIFPMAFFSKSLLLKPMCYGGGLGRGTFGRWL